MQALTGFALQSGPDGWIILPWTGGSLWLWRKPASRDFHEGSDSAPAQKLDHAKRWSQERGQTCLGVESLCRLQL